MINAPAGSLDRVFGVDVPRTVPIDYFVTLTSTYSSSTGYSWIELRGSPGDGFATPTAALEGDQAYEVTGRTDLAVGTICRMFIDRDQTIYGLIVLREGTSGDCAGCGWLAGMGASRCLRVTAAGVLTDLYLTSDDGNTWTSDDLLTICSVDYTVSVSRNAGGAPQLTLTESGSGATAYTGQWNCCGCSYAKWTFNLQTICPEEADTGSPCTNVVELRVDSAGCPAPGTSCSVGGIIAIDETVAGTNGSLGTDYWHIPVTPGTYHIDFTRTGFTLTYSLGTYTGSDCTGSATSLGSGSATGCVSVTIPDGNQCLCIVLTGGGDYTLVVHEGACP